MAESGQTKRYVLIPPLSTSKTARSSARACSAFHYSRLGIIMCFGSAHKGCNYIVSTIAFPSRLETLCGSGGDWRRGLTTTKASTAQRSAPSREERNPHSYMVFFEHKLTSASCGFIPPRHTKKAVGEHLLLGSCTTHCLVARVGADIGQSGTLLSGFNLNVTALVASTARVADLLAKGLVGFLLMREVVIVIGL